MVAQFEEETGIDVQVTLSNNEDMISKLRATGGAGFDLAEIRLDDGVLVQGRVASDNLRTGHRAELYIRPESLVLSGDALSAGFSSMQAKVRTTLFDGANSRVEAENCGQPVYARLRKFDPQLEEAALNLGATPLVAWFTVTLPWLLPSIFGAAAMAFLMSFENFNTTVMLTGSDTPLTVALFNRLREGSTPVLNAVALLLMVGSALLALLVMGRSSR